MRFNFPYYQFNILLNYRTITQLQSCFHYNISNNISACIFDEIGSYKIEFALVAIYIDKENNST